MTEKKGDDRAEQMARRVAERMLEQFELWKTAQDSGEPVEYEGDMLSYDDLVDRIHQEPLSLQAGLRGRRTGRVRAAAGDRRTRAARLRQAGRIRRAGVRAPGIPGLVHAVGAVGLHDAGTGRGNPVVCLAVLVRRELTCGGRQEYDLVPLEGGGCMT